MVCQRPADPSPADRFGGHHLECPKTRVAGIVEQHRHRRVVLDREIEDDPDVFGHVGLGVFDPRDAADNVGSDRHGGSEQPLSSGFSNDSVLGEGNNLQVDQTCEFVAQLDENLDAPRAGLGVNVGQSPDVRVAVVSGHRHRTSPGLEHRRRFLIVLDSCRGLDRRHRLAHLAALVVGERGIAQLLECEDLVEMQVGVDEGLGDQIAGGIHLDVGKEVFRLPARWPRRPRRGR